MNLCPRRSCHHVQILVYFDIILTVYTVCMLKEIFLLPSHLMCFETMDVNTVKERRNIIVKRLTSENTQLICPTLTAETPRYICYRGNTSKSNTGGGRITVVNISSSVHTASEYDIKAHDHKTNQSCKNTQENKVFFLTVIYLGSKFILLLKWSYLD